MKNTPTCNCGLWIWNRESRVWHERHSALSLFNGGCCPMCGEELPANPEREEADVLSTPEPNDAKPVSPIERMNNLVNEFVDRDQRKEEAAPTELRDAADELFLYMYAVHLRADITCYAKVLAAERGTSFWACTWLTASDKERLAESLRLVAAHMPGFDADTRGSTNGN